MDIGHLVDFMIRSGHFYRLINNPLAQFGPPTDPMLGASILPEKTVRENMFKETAIRYRTPIANHGTRYSDPQKKGNALVGSFNVELGYSDIAAEFEGKEYDDLVRLIYYMEGTQGVAGGGVTEPTPEMIQTMLRWADKGLVEPLKMRNEVDRWSAIVNGYVDMFGADNYYERVLYPTAPNQRITVGGTWSNDAYDPLLDIQAMIRYLRNKGYFVRQIVTTFNVMTILSVNAKMRLRAGYTNVNDGVTVGIPINLTEEDVNKLLAKNKMPPLITYDKLYNRTADTQRVYPEGTMTFICDTDRDQSLERGDLEPAVIQKTLGYVGVGNTEGRPTPGAVIVVRAKQPGKKLGFEGEAFQASLPILELPEALAVLTGIA